MFQLNNLILTIACLTTIEMLKQIIRGKYSGDWNLTRLFYLHWQAGPSFYHYKKYNVALSLLDNYQIFYVTCILISPVLRFSMYPYVCKFISLYIGFLFVSKRVQDRQGSRMQKLCFNAD